MALHPNQRRHWDRVYPGLVGAVEALGAGEFEAEPPQIHLRGRGMDMLELRLTYVFHDRPKRKKIEVRLSIRLKEGIPPYVPNERPFDLSHWRRVYYRMAYGAERDDSEFRFDLSKPAGHHVHMKPNLKCHLPCSDVEPDVTDLDPFVFVEMVRKYRTDRKNYPVKLKALSSRKRS